LKENPTNAAEEMQTATFGDGKYRVMYHTPSEKLRIIDEENQRGTLYKVQREKLLEYVTLLLMRSKILSEKK
jgi:hypothetical protein